MAKKAKKKTPKKKTKKTKPLSVVKDNTQLERDFARIYALTGNAAIAYPDAGYKDQGENNRVQGYRLLQKPHVQDLVEQWRRLIERKLDIRENRILAELAAVAFADPLDILDITRNGGICVKNLDKIPEYARRAISSIEEIETPSGTLRLKVKFHPKIAALTQIAAIKGMIDPDGRRNKKGVHVTLKYGKGRTVEVDVEQ